jgi:hypothetical protein
MFPRDMVFLRNISVDTLHKGDTENDDDDGDDDNNDDDDDNNNNNNNNKREMSQWCGIKRYTQTEKLQQIDEI